MILANGCNITKSEKFKGVWILSVPTVFVITPFTELRLLEFPGKVQKLSVRFDEGLSEKPKMH